MTLFILSSLQTLKPVTKFRYCQFLRQHSVRMASAAPTNNYNVFIPNDVVPTAETKIVLAEKVPVSPLGQCHQNESN